MAKKKATKKATKKPAKKAVKKAVKKATKKPAKKATKKAAPVKAAKPVKEVKKAGPVKPVKPALVTPKNKGSQQYTQSELFDCIRGFCGFTSRTDARKFYDQFAAMIQQSLKSGYKLNLPGLGKMQVRKTKARMGRNPMTQEQIMIPAKRKVAFTPTKALKEAVL